MPRKPRVFIEGGVYHVYNRFARGAGLFGEEDEAGEFLELLRAARDRDGLTIFAWALLSNHYHLALRCGPVSLSRTMGFVQARFGQGYNRRHLSTGPLWQSRFKARLVEDSRYLSQLVLYIHLNPVVAGLVDDPADYALSGHQELLRKKRGALLDSERTLSLFGTTVRTARRRYVKALEGTREVEWRTELPGRLPWWGEEPDRPLAAPAPDAWVDERGASTAALRPIVKPARFLKASAGFLGIEIEALTGPGSGHEMTRRRTIVVALAAERWRLRAADLAPLFGRRNDVVSRWVRRGVERRRQDPECSAVYEELDAHLLATRFREEGSE